MRELWRRLYFLAHRRRMERELAEEMAAHREMMAADDRAAFGNTLRLREEARDAWGWTWLDQFGQDLAYGARMLRKSPLFTLSAVAVLAVGIGVNVGAFQLLDTLLLRPLPVRDPQTLYNFSRRNYNSHDTGVPYPELKFMTENATVLSAVMGITERDLFFGDSATERVRTQYVTANYFSELGAGAAWGRVLDPMRDETAEAEPVVVLSYGFWQRRFGPDSSIAGKMIRLNKKPVRVVGVASFDFTGFEPVGVDAWAPLVQEPYLVEGSKLMTAWDTSLHMFGRLKPSITPRAAEDGLRPLVARLKEQQPKVFWDGEFLEAQPAGYLASMDRDVLPVFGLAATLVLLVLVVACANLGNLQLAKALARNHEIRIRASVGAGRGRLVRQLLTESLLLALLGSAVGLFLAFIAAKGVLTILNAPQFLNPSLDYRVVLFVLGMAVLATLLFGLAPALQATRRGKPGTRARMVLVGGQVAASCILLIVSSLLVRGIHRILTAHPGFEYKQALTVDPELYGHGFQPAEAEQYMNELAARVRQLRGVESVALATIPPLGHRISSEGFDKYPGVEVFRNDVDSGFLRTMEIPIVRGRGLQPGDRDVVVVSESLARKIWRGEDAIGKRYPRENTVETVVGVAGNARLVALSNNEATEVYRPLATRLMPNTVLVVKATGAPSEVAGEVRDVAASMDRKVTPAVTLLRTSFEEQVKNSQRGAFVVSLLGALALLLAATGIYGVVAFAVTQRTREIGVRMALGAQPGHVLGLVLRQFSRPAAAGLVVGVAGAAGLSLVLRRVLYGLSHLDPFSYAAGLVLFGAVAALAALLPARRALRVDPAMALRYE